MSDTTQDTGTATNDAGGTQEADATQVDASKAASTQATEGADSTAKAEESKTEEITYEFKAPEGVELNQDDLAKFTDIAKELKLPADKAQALVDLAAAREQARADAFAKQVQTWADEVKADKELGTDENLAIARKAVETFGGDEMRQLLDSTGMGNHPAVVRFMLNVGKKVSEDTIVKGDTGGNAKPRDHASVLYGTPAN